VGYKVVVWLFVHAALLSKVEENIVQDIKDLEKEFNEKLLKLSSRLDGIQVHVSSYPHPKFEGNPKEKFITIWAHDKITTNRAF